VHYTKLSQQQVSRGCLLRVLTAISTGRNYDKTTAGVIQEFGTVRLHTNACTQMVTTSQAYVQRHEIHWHFVTCLLTYVTIANIIVTKYMYKNNNNINSSAMEHATKLNIKNSIPTACQ